MRKHPPQQLAIQNLVQHRWQRLHTACLKRSIGVEQFCSKNTGIGRVLQTTQQRVAGAIQNFCVRVQKPNGFAAGMYEAQIVRARKAGVFLALDKNDLRIFRGQHLPATVK